MDQATPADDPTEAVTDEELEHAAGGHHEAIILFNASGRPLKIGGRALHSGDH